LKLKIFKKLRQRASTQNLLVLIKKVYKTLKQAEDDYSITKKLPIEIFVENNEVCLKFC